MSTIAIVCWKLSKARWKGPTKWCFRTGRFSSSWYPDSHCGLSVTSGMETLRKMLRAKIHRAVVTEANLDYEGSLTIPPELLAASDIHEYELIHVWNVTRGTRFET